MTRSPLIVVRRAPMPRRAKSIEDASYGEWLASIAVLTAIAALAALLDHLFGQ